MPCRPASQATGSLLWSQPKRLEHPVTASQLTSRLVKTVLGLKRGDDNGSPARDKMVNVRTMWGFPGGSVVKALPAKQEPQETQVLGWGRSPGEGNSSPLQYSYLENPMDRGAWGGYSPCRITIE